VSFEHVLKYEHNFSVFIFRSGLPVNGSVGVYSIYIVQLLSQARTEV
jgi:hypothetical protein